MTSRFDYKLAWVALIALGLASFAIVAIPVYLIQPFAPQTPRSLEISFLLKSWSFGLTLAAAMAVIVLSFFLWRESRRWLSKAFLIFPLLISLFCVWFARQNHFEWMFNPLANSSYAKASEANFVADDDMVLAVKINDEAVAYPVRQMAYHHIVQDVVGGMPITATY